MATSGFRPYGEDENVKGPMEYVSETEECICGWCGQLLIPNHNNETPEAHFKSCKNLKDNGLLMIFKHLRKIERKFLVLNADISEIKEKMDAMKTEVMAEIKADVLNVKTELNNEILSLKEKNRELKDEDQSTLFSKVKVLEEGMLEKLREMGVAQEIKMAEVNGRVSGVTEAISNAVHAILEVKEKKVTPSADNSLSNELERSINETEALSVQLRQSEGDNLTTKTRLEVGLALPLKTGTEAISEQMQTNDGDVQVLKREMEDEALKQLAKKRKCFQVQVSPFDQTTIPINCFNLVFHNYIFQPSFKWTIDGINRRIAQKTFELSSHMFQWNGYPVQARAKLQLKEDKCFYLSMCLKDENQSEDLKPIPLVYYLLKNTNLRNPKHKCLIMGYLFTSTFNSSLEFERMVGRKSWFNVEQYKVNESIEIEIYVEPPLMTQHVYSFDGTLEWAIENFKKRTQLEKECLVLYQESAYFYTEPDGYRIQARIFLNEVKRSGPSACIMFRTGKFDDKLQKSFPHSTTITLINRKDPERSINKTIIEDITSKKYYDFKLCEFEEMKNLVENDTLFCKVVIKALGKS